MLPPALARADEHLPARGSRPVAARQVVRQGEAQAAKLVFYTRNNPRGVAVAEILEFNLKQIGIDLEVKYYDRSNTLAEKAGTRGEPFDLVINGWSVDYVDAASFMVPLLDTGLPSTRASNSPLREPAGERQHRCGEPPDR